MAVPPDFVRGGDVNAVAEFSHFLADLQELAAYQLAKLTAMQTCDPSEEVPHEDKATTVKGLYCRRASEWCIFYALASPDLPSAVTVALVAQTNFSKPFSALELEAERRLRAVGRLGA